MLAPGQAFHTHRGAVAHDDLIGQPEGSVVRATGGTQYIALRPLLADYTVSMSRGATVVYPKDATVIVGPGRHVPRSQGASRLARARAR